MKKRQWIILSAVVMAILCVVGLTACGTEEEDSSDGVPSVQTYTVTANDGTGYDVEVDKVTVEYGDEVTVTVDVTAPDKYVKSVKANSEELGKNADGTYKVTITANTTITVELAEYEEITSDGGVTWAASNTDTMIVGASNGWYWDENDNMVNAWIFDVSADWNLASAMDEDDTVLTSSDQSVIPDSAISYALNTESHGNQIIGFDVRIDTSKIAEGHTWLTMSFRASNGTSPEGTICVKIEVVDRIQLETMEETIVIAYDDYAMPGDDVTIRFYDQDHTDGQYIGEEPAPAYIEIKTQVGEEGTTSSTIDYVSGHSYTIQIYKAAEWYDGLLDTLEKQENLLLIEGDVIFGSSSTATGLNRYQDGVLTLVDPGRTVELTVNTDFYEANSH